MTRTQRVLGGFTIGYVHMTVATVVGLWLTPFLLARLGAATYGLWLVGTQVIAYLLPANTTAVHLHKEFKKHKLNSLKHNLRFNKNDDVRLTVAPRRLTN